MSALRRCVGWLAAKPANPPSRWVTIVMWVFLVATPLGAVYGFWNIYQDDNTAKCEQRVDTRNDLRGVFSGIFDYVDPTHIKPKINDLRAQLDRTYPPITLEECLAGTV